MELRRGADGRLRCAWAGSDPLYQRYHDLEWGRPVADDRRLFEKISLEGFQSGLSWYLILRKREGFRRAFCGFDPQAVAGFGPQDVARLLADPGIVRNRAKIEGVVANAKRYLELTRECSLAAFCWGREGEPDQLSRDLKRRGWRFVGPTIIHAFMQAVGMVNDHTEGCFARELCDQERATFVRPVR